jgi:hypothetical protein
VVVPQAAAMPSVAQVEGDDILHVHALRQAASLDVAL